MRVLFILSEIFCTSLNRRLMILEFARRFQVILLTNLKGNKDEPHWHNKLIIFNDPIVKAFFI